MMHVNSLTEFQKLVYFFGWLALVKTESARQVIIVAYQQIIDY